MDHPMVNGVPVHLPPETHFVVRFIHDGRVIGFRTSVLGMVRQPSALVFCIFPDHVEESRLRKHERYPVHIESVLALDRVSGDINAYPRTFVLNLSKGGCMVESAIRPDKGDHLYLTLFLPEHGQVDDVEVEVKRIDPKGAEHFRLGLAFADLLAPGYEQIKGYLHLLEAFQVRA